MQENRELTPRDIPVEGDRVLIKEIDSDCKYHGVRTEIEGLSATINFIHEQSDYFCTASLTLDDSPNFSFELESEKRLTLTGTLQVIEKASDLKAKKPYRVNLSTLTEIRFQTERIQECNYHETLSHYYRSCRNKEDFPTEILKEQMEQYLGEVIILNDIIQTL